MVDNDWRPVPVADAYLRHLRLGAGRAEGTSRTYAGDLACYLAWCERSGRDLVAGAQALGLFVAMLKTTPVARAGAGQGRVRGPGRINHMLTAVRELYKHAVRNVSRGMRQLSYADWMSASRLGSLIHAVVGSCGGVGGRWRNRSGFAL